MGPLTSRRMFFSLMSLLFVFGLTASLEDTAALQLCSAPRFTRHLSCIMCDLSFTTTW